MNKICAAILSLVSAHSEQCGLQQERQRQQINHVRAELEQ